MISLKSLKTTLRLFVCYLRTCKYFKNKNIKKCIKYENYFRNLFIITHQPKLMFI